MRAQIRQLYYLEEHDELLSAAVKLVDRFIVIGPVDRANAFTSSLKQ